MDYNSRRPSLSLQADSSDSIETPSSAGSTYQSDDLGDLIPRPGDVSGAETGLRCHEHDAYFLEDDFLMWIEPGAYVPGADPQAYGACQPPPRAASTPCQDVVGSQNFVEDLIKIHFETSATRREKRRQQNRKAQQAYRSRKEEHLSNLTRKIEDVKEDCARQAAQSRALQHRLAEVRAERDRLLPLHPRIERHERATGREFQEVAENLLLVYRSNE